MDIINIMRAIIIICYIVNSNYMILCLPQNPYYLMHGLKDPNRKTPILYKSINYLNKRPLIKAKYFSNFKNILIIGSGFKSGQTLTAFSPTITIYEKLKKMNKSVTLFDEKQTHISLDDLKNYDCLIISYLPKSININLINDYKLSNFEQVFNF
jgi:hypothetical protein